MRTYREVLKYLKDYVVDRVILTEFDPLTLNDEWKGYTPTINVSNRTLYSNSVEFDNIEANKPLLLEMLYVERLDDRATLEVDLKSSVEIQEDGLIISLCEGYNTNSPKMVLKNSEVIPADTLITVSFNINTSITKRVDSLSKIRTIAFEFEEDVSNLVISKVDAENPEFTFTVEDIMEYYTIGLNYVLSGLGLSSVPDNDRLKEATYKATASYMWMKQDGNSAKYGNSRNYAVHLLKEVDKAILEYINSGSVAVNQYKNIRKLGGFKWSRI